jgi:hypothetical protein
LHVSAGPTLIKNWDYEPTVFGQIVKDQLAAAAAARSLRTGSVTLHPITTLENDPLH